MLGSRGVRISRSVTSLKRSPSGGHTATRPGNPGGSRPRTP